MAIAERSLAGTKDATTTTGAAQTLSVTPTGMQTDDYMEVVFSTYGGIVTPAAPAGWTQIGATQTAGAGGGIQSLSVWRKFAGVGEAGPYQFDNGSGLNRRMTLSIRAWSGVNTTNPLEGTVQQGAATGVTSHTHAASTSSGADRVWVLATAKSTDAGATTTINTPAGFTETADQCSAHATNPNANAALHFKAVGSGSTGTQQVTSPDGTNQHWLGVAHLLVGAGATVVEASATISGTLAVAGTAEVVGTGGAPTVTVTTPASGGGGGYMNACCYAPLGVGHQWLAAYYGDVFGPGVTVDGLTWKPCNNGIGAPFVARHTHRGAGIEGSQTVANRLWGWSSQDGDGTNGGTLLRGTFSAATGLVSWTNYATPATYGPAAGTTQAYKHPRQVGRTIALDEADDTLYLATINGITRVQGLTSSPTVTEQRALAGEVITGMVIDPTNTQIMWATARSDSGNPGVYRISNIRSGTVTTTRYAVLTDPQDLCLVDTGATRYVFVAARAQGVRRWTVAADISVTGNWADITSDYDTGGAGNGPSGIDAYWDGANIQVLCHNAGNNSMTNAGGYTRQGQLATPDWVNEVSGWSVNLTPWGETDGPHWQSTGNLPGYELNEGLWDSASVRINPGNPAHAIAAGRSGMYQTRNAWQLWRPNDKGVIGVMGWNVAARPGFGDQLLGGDGDHSLQKWTNLVDQPVVVRPRPGGCMGLMWTEDGAEAAWACGDPFAGASEAGVFVSTNGGTTWVDQDLPVGVDVGGVAIGYTTAGTRVLLTVFKTGIYRKVGAGGWSVVSTLTTPQPSQDHNQHFAWPRNSDASAPDGRRQYVYCTGHNGLLRSDDWGATWTTIVARTSNSESAGAIDYDPAAPNTLYYTVDNGNAGDTGLWKVTNAHATPTATKIGPTLTSPGPCAVDPDTGVVYVCTTTAESGGLKLYASPANNPGAGTVFEDITDPQWAAGPMAPKDMTVTKTGKIVVANHHGGYFYATRAGSGSNVITASAHIGTDAAGQISGYGDVYEDLYVDDVPAGVGLTISANAEVISAVPGVVDAAATLAVGTSTITASPTVVTTTPPPTPEPDPQWFNGTFWPRIHLLFGLAGSLDPGPAYLHLGVGPGLDTGKLGGTTWVGPSAGADIRSISISGRGRDGPIDAASPATCTIVLNNFSGNYDPDSPSSPFAGLDVGTPVDLRCERPIGTIWRLFYGEVTSATLDAGIDPTVTLVCADGLEKLGRAQLTTQTSPVGDGDRAGARINRLADAAAYPTVLRRVDAGYTTVAPTIYGESALELMRKTESTEFGFLYVDGGGVLVFYDRHQAALAARSTTVQATFSDTEVPDQPGMVELELDWSRDRTFNDVHVTRDPTPHEQPFPGTDPADDEPVEQVATDPITSAPEVWGTLSLPAQVGQLHRDDHQALAMAQYLVNRFKVSQARIRTVRVNALRRDLWDVLLPLGLLDRIAVYRTYGTGAAGYRENYTETYEAYNRITAELLIQGMSLQINSDPPTWEYQFDTALPPAAPTLWRLGTSALGSGKLGW
jgi:hypothetical protein